MANSLSLEATVSTGPDRKEPCQDWAVIFLEPAEQCGCGDMLEMQISGLILGLLKRELQSGGGVGGMGGVSHSLDTDRWLLCTTVWEWLNCEKSILDGEFHKKKKKAPQLCNLWPLAQDPAHTQNAMHFPAYLPGCKPQSLRARIKITKR